MLGEIVRTALEREPDLELIPAGDASSVASTEPAGVDLLIMVLPGGDVVTRCRELVTRFPNARVLAALEDDRGDAGLFELHTRGERLGSLSPAELAQSVREAARA
jgi:beta-glucosidase-like glycosyl hydrolase